VAVAGDAPVGVGLVVDVLAEPVEVGVDVFEAEDDGFDEFCEAGEVVAGAVELAFSVFEPVVDAFDFAVFVGALAAAVVAVEAGSAVGFLLDGGAAPDAVASPSL
jgi:hypothetical protein